MFVYAITSHKGGVGKTTTAVNLGAALAHEGKRVLLVDLDPKSSLTAAVGLTPSGLSLGEALLEPGCLPEAIRPCVGGMDCVTATATLAVVFLELAMTEGSAFRLSQALQSVWERYDYALIDCPSSLGSALTNALTAAHIALVPLQCDYLSLRGLADTQEMVIAIRETTNPLLRLRVVGTMFDRRIAHAHDVFEAASAALPGQVYQTIIPRTVRLAEAPATGQTILEYAWGSLGAQAYRLLGREVLQEVDTYETTRRYSDRDAEPALSGSAA
ncbi:MAG TPA: ParA family protein [Chthonomonadaceae bacterium]|nr:ParA family protein [Chthonomonadaceae bacterium]